MNIQRGSGGNCGHNPGRPQPTPMDTMTPPTGKLFRDKQYTRFETSRTNIVEHVSQG